MEESERRVGLNEAVFREVNERLKDLNEAFTAVTETMDLICECADTTCTGHIEMRPDEYEALRAEPTHFAVLPGHALDGASEHVIAQRPGYHVVEKLGGAADVAEATDPNGE